MKVTRIPLRRLSLHRYDLDNHLTYQPITPADATDRAAALTVTENARDRDDAALILAALGLVAP